MWKKFFRGSKAQGFKIKGERLKGFGDKSQNLGLRTE
jgi:hypothetical protein